MTIPKLTILVILLGCSVVLVATNPSIPDYAAFLRASLLPALKQRLERVDPALSSEGQKLVRTLVQSQGSQLLDSLIRPNTIRRNFGLFSLFETRALGSRVMVLGIGRQFIPVAGIEEVSLKIGRLPFAPHQ